jgi:ubiquinone/menaquinone biosynthesis C-methylase UbiE
LLSALKLAARDSVLDVGCGTGVFTELLGTRFQEAVGIDPSRRSLEQAIAATTGIEYVASSVEDYAKSGRSFASIAANMTMMNVPNIFSATRAVGNLCQAGGVFAFTITHPWFWPVYWDYANAEWFKYSDEIFIESEFRISNTKSGMATTHVHRPLGTYIEAIETAGFRVSELREPMPSPAIEQKYPKPWLFPRFLMISCIKEF